MYSDGTRRFIVKYQNGNSIELRRSETILNKTYFMLDL